METPSQAIMECKNCGRTYYKTEDFLAHTSRWRVCSEGHLWFNCACESTNVIMQGKYPWFQPFAHLSPKGQSIFNDIPTLSELPRLPMSFMKLQQMIDDENASSQNLAELAKQDPILSSLILRIAENQTTHRQGAFRSLSHAISMVGRHHLKEIILIAAISSIEAKTKVFSTDDFWDHSLTIGRIAEHLAKRFSPKFIGDEAYIAGCVCNLGKLVLAICRPDLVDRFQSEVNEIHTLGPWTEAENRYMGYQHTVLGEIGAALWGLSKGSSEAIRMHHSVADSVNAPGPELYELIALANQFAHWIWLQPHQMEKDLFAKLLQRFHLSKKDSETLAKDMMPLAVQDKTE